MHLFKGVEMKRIVSKSIKICVCIGIGFLLGCLCQPFYQSGFFDVCFSCGPIKISRAELENVNQSLYDAGIEDAYLVPYKNGMLRYVVYGFTPWSAKKVSKNLELIREKLPFCEHIKSND